MNYPKALKLKKTGFILVLVFVLTLFVGLCPAYASSLERNLRRQNVPSSQSLAPAISSITRPVITESSKKATTIAIQQKLVSLGYDTGGIDGIFGPKTRRAVMLFQASRNLTVDAIVGPQTRAALGLTN